MRDEQVYDEEITKKILSIENTLRKWAVKQKLWDEDESKFWSHLDYFDDEPSETPCILVLTSSGELGSFINGSDYEELQDDYFELLDQLGVHQELETYGVATFWFDDEDDSFAEKVQEYFEWQWICGLVKPEFSELYIEIYDWFSKKPDDFVKLSPRGYEVIIDGILKNNGYRTQLGTGQSDGGVDIRLYSNEVIGEAVTLVQAKRYASHRPIGLEAVQALSANVDDERANRGLFITTSRYLPGVERFANRQNRKLQLATSNDLAKWSQFAKDSIIRDKSKLVSPENVRSILMSNTNKKSLEGRIFHAHIGVTMILNSFVVILRETKTATLVMSLPRKSISGDSQVGYEVPIKDADAMKNFGKETVFRTKIKKESGEVTLWGNRNLYSEWNGEPVYFSWLD